LTFKIVFLGKEILLFAARDFLFWTSDTECGVWAKRIPLVHVGEEFALLGFLDEGPVDHQGDLATGGG